MIANIIRVDYTYPLAHIEAKWHSQGWLQTANIYISEMLRALNRSLSKYLTAQDTRGTPTLTKENRTLARLGSLLFLRPRSTIKVIFLVLLSLVLSKLIKKLDIALNW